MRAIRASRFDRARARRYTTASARSAPGSPMRCYFLFGRPAYLLPLILGVAAWRLTRARRDG